MTVALGSILTVEPIPIDRLRPDPANPRRISDEELDSLTRSLHQFGFVQPVLARKEDGVVIGGQQRLVAARRLGLTTVPVTYLDLSIEQAHLLNLALNKIGGSWDEQLLARLLADLQSSRDVDLSLSGFADDEIKDLLRSLETRDKAQRPESFDLDAALEEATRSPRTKPGELWALGEHRLLVGDATKPEDIARVLAGRHAAMAFTDPPYNVSLGNHGGQQRGARKRRIANDSLDTIAWESFVRAWARSLLASVDGALYICMSSKEMPLVSRVLAEEGAHWSDTVIWAKDRFVLGRADYQRSYEPIPERTAEAAEARRLGGLRRRKEGTIAVAYDLPGLDTVDGIRRLLEIVSTDGLGMENGVPRLRALISTAVAATNLLKVGEFEERLAALEAAVSHRQPQESAAFPAEAAP